MAKSQLQKLKQTIQLIFSYEKTTEKKKVKKKVKQPSQPSKAAH